MNKRRLLKLADLLEADAKRKRGVQFDLGTWGEFDSGEPAVSCNTTACAMGLAALSGAFARQGLGYRTRKPYGPDEEGGSIDITFKGAGDDMKATVALFGIHYAEAAWLFTPDAYDDETTGAKAERMVAKRIRDFVNGKARPAFLGE